ncbi:MAG: restriction endonuclease [Actinobacteria bacterium]|nr:restriction endonuclease [Actinomycetota bacterium]
MKYYYQREIRHDGLNKYKIVRGETQYEVDQKANTQLHQWAEMYNKKLETERKEQGKIKQQEFIEGQIQKAEEETENAKIKINNIRNFLKDSLIRPPITFDILKDKSKFSEPKPIKKLPHDRKEIEIKPELKDFAPKIGLIDKMIKSKLEQKNKIAEEQYIEALKEYNSKVNANNWIEQKYKENLATWGEKEKGFYINQNKENELIDKKKAKYESKDPSAINEFIELILSKSYYPKDFKKDFTIDLNNENKILIIDFKLPELENIPKLKEVKFNKLKKILEESYISDSELKEIYDSFLYQVSLKIIYDIYKSDYVNTIEAVVFNGWIETIDKKTGKDVTLCILSVQASKEEFLSINLEKINPKECFKGLKGVSSAKLHTTTPIAPILQMNKDDKRFISSYDVIKNIDNSQNIAAMDWEDFEHLIREIFEKEFSQNGGEVKVTQSSRDGGVDAVAFDPDPLRGGKIVIQAKRYTNVVGVSAVRDLYGTLIKEGATRGILVTTADYGSDAYGFAKGLPLTLLNGSNLLQLLEKHGHKAKIDLKEAKLIIEEQKK